jgi:hypothetical protein
MKATLAGREARSVVAAATALALLAAGAACEAAPGPHVVNGTVALSTFPEAVVAARAVRAGSTVVEARVGPDGSFSLTIPAGRGYRIDFVAGAGRPVLVFPRRAGEVDATFDVRGGGPAFDLGLVRYVGDPRARTWAFLTAGGGDADDLECEDGIDLESGAVCVDDDDDEGAGVCEDDDDEWGDDDEVECEDGIDPATGAPCVDDDGDEAEDPPDEAAVADHNLPPAVGCDDDEEDDD